MLPTYEQYKHKVDTLVSSDELTVEQAIILLACFKGTLTSAPLHINYLMQITGLNWKNINYLLNGLVLRKAIRKIEEKYYIV